MPENAVKLASQIMDLEARNSQLTEELNAVKANPSAAAASTRISPDWIPRNPPRHSLTGHKASITRVTFHPIYNTLVTASEDATLKVWDWESGEFERTVKGHTKAVMDCDFDAKGELLASCSSDLTIKIWAVSDDYKNTKTLYGHDHSVSSVKFMPSGDHLVSASRDKTVRMWEVSNGYCVRTFQAHLEWVRAVEPSSDGRHIVTASSDQVCLNEWLHTMVYVTFIFVTDRKNMGRNQRGNETRIAWSRQRHRSGCLCADCLLSCDSGISGYCMSSELCACYIIPQSLTIDCPKRISGSNDVHLCCDRIQG